MNRKLILKSPRFVPFGANLAGFKGESETPVTEYGSLTRWRVLPCVLMELINGSHYTRRGVKCRVTTHYTLSATH